ncbi:TPA: hypothetical protein I7213_09570 [Vibrio vulnificus]|nr:hypothetical protein [Vibrio vulnificus]HDY7578931.1 hypothetical protein [Vibrio vulnificus]
MMKLTTTLLNAVLLSPALVMANTSDKQKLVLDVERAAKASPAYVLQERLPANQKSPDAPPPILLEPVTTPSLVKEQKAEQGANQDWIALWQAQKATPRAELDKAGIEAALKALKEQQPVTKDD